MGITQKKKVDDQTSKKNLRINNANTIDMYYVVFVLFSCRYAVIAWLYSYDAKVIRLFQKVHVYCIVLWQSVLSLLRRHFSVLLYQISTVHYFAHCTFIVK